MGAAESNNVTVLEYQGKAIHLVGTAHVSQKSVEEVIRVISSLRPDTVCVELDRSRFEALTDPKRYRRLNIFDLIEHDRLLFTLGGLILSSYQRRMGAKLGVTPGAELLAAVTCAREVGAELVLADRDVQMTLRRSWARLGLSDRAQLMLAMGVSLFAGSSEISAEQIEALKDRDTIQEMMSELAKHMPSLQIPLIDERDRYLISMMREAPGPVIVGVVGAGHVSGMLRYRDSSIDRAALSIPPTPSPWAPLWAWLRSAIYWGVLGASFFFTPSGYAPLYAWCAVIGGATFVTMLASRASPWSTLTAGLVAPFVELIPLPKLTNTIAWLEATLRRPTEEDCERVNDSLLSLREMRRNPFIRVLLIAAGAGLTARVAAVLVTLWLSVRLFI